MKKIIFLSFVMFALLSTISFAADWLPMEEYRDFSVANPEVALKHARQFILEEYNVPFKELEKSKVYVHSIKDADIATIIVMVEMQAKPNDYYLVMLDETGMNALVLYTVNYEAPLKQFLKNEVAERYEGGW